MFIGVAIVSLIIFWMQTIYVLLPFAQIDTYECDSNANIGVVQVRGELDFVENAEEGIVSADIIIDKLQFLANQDHIQMVVLDVDSPGGIATAGENIADTLKWSTNGKKTTAVIRENGLSAAYLAATGADTIYASRLSNIGSIGVTASYLSNAKKLEAEGIEFVSFASAPYKDMWFPDRNLSTAEHEKVLEDLMQTHRVLVSLITENRSGLSFENELTEEEVIVLADGTSYLGQKALEVGLIDKLGTLSDVVTDFEESEGVVGNFCVI